MFFERLAETYPTVLVFEDMQWADASLLDFVEYLLEWSRNQPLFVVTLARPELLERRPTWGAGHRNFTSLYLEPLSAQAMEQLLTGAGSGPARVASRSQILARAEGVPLYAVETVRMLLDRGLLVEDGAAYRVAGEIESLEVPETLHALVAARLDGLSAEERRLLQDAAVLGKTFTPGSLAALTGQASESSSRCWHGLVRKELLGLQSDPRSPEHGQYGFLQDIVRHVAYETLPRRDRRAKHLAAAEYLRLPGRGRGCRGGRIAPAGGVPARSRRARRRAVACPGCRAALVHAGERAASFGASAEARRYFEQAAELAGAPSEQACRSFVPARWRCCASTSDAAGPLFEQAIALYEEAGDTHAAARASSWLAYSEQIAGRTEQAIERMEEAYAAIADDEPDSDLALLLTRLGRRPLLRRESGTGGRADRARPRHRRSAAACPRCFAAAGPRRGSSRRRGGPRRRGGSSSSRSTWRALTS